MIGIIPAAGNATRLMGLPKALLPIGEQTLIGRHIDLMSQVGASRVVIGSKGAAYAMLNDLYSGETVLYHADTETMSETVLQAQRFLYDDEPVMFSMPDTYVDDDQAFIKLSAALDDGADVAVGVFLTRPEQRHKLGMCRCGNGHVEDVIDKPIEETHLIWAWGVLAWTPTFWQYIKPEDPHVGYALPRALKAALDVRSVEITGQYFDCGTWTEYADLIRHLTTSEGVPPDG